MIKYITRERLESWGPCDDYTAERIDELAAGRSRIAVTTVFDLPIPLEYRVWMLCHEGILSNEAFRCLSRKFAMHVIDLWDVTNIVRRFLETGYKSIRDAAMDSARTVALNEVGASKFAAMSAMYACRSISLSAMDASSVDAWDATWDASKTARKAMAANNLELSEAFWQLEQIRKEIERC